MGRVIVPTGALRPGMRVRITATGTFGRRVPRLPWWLRTAAPLLTAAARLSGSCWYWGRDRKVHWWRR